VPARIPRKRRIQTFSVLVISLMMVICMELWLLLWYVSPTSACMYTVCSTYALWINSASLVFSFCYSMPISHFRIERRILTNFAVPFPRSGHFWPYICCGSSLTTVPSVVHVLASGCVRGLFSKTLQIITLLGVFSLIPLSFVLNVGSFRLCKVLVAVLPVRIR